MNSFKIIFPTGYQVNDIDDDNIDLNIVLSDERVYFVTLFTLKNINRLMKKDNEVYFWADSMLIVKNLQKETIRNTIIDIISDKDQVILEYLGSISGVFGPHKSFDQFEDMSN
jgi:hypothetical protein